MICSLLTPSSGGLQHLKQFNQRIMGLLTVKGAETKTRWRSRAEISRDKLSIKTEILGKPGIIVKAPIVTPRKHDLFLHIQKATD